MKRIFATLALLGAVLVGSAGTAAWAEEKPAAPAASAAAVTAPAAAAAEAAPAAAPALVANKGDNAWVMVSAALVILMSIPGLALFYGGLVARRTCSRCSCRSLSPSRSSACCGWFMAIPWPLPRGEASSARSTSCS
jgi:hypothetical protein